MAVLGDDDPAADPIAQDLLDSPGHRRRRLAASHNDDLANLGEIEFILTHAQAGSLSGQVPADRLARVHRPHGSLEDPAGCLSQL
jgi:hypothetical protein